MQKKLIALAVAGLASTAAFAQTNVTIYGVADLGYVYGTGDRAGAGNSGSMNFSGVQSGLMGGSRIGFRGEEALGNGMKAVFTAEYGLDLDVNSGVGNTTSGLNNRQTWIGLSHGTLGTVTLGRQYSPGFLAAGRNDAFGSSTGIGSMARLQQVGFNTINGTNGGRVDNSIAYRSPTWAGFTVSAITGFGENAQNTTNVQTGAAPATNAGAGVSRGDNQLYGAGLNYANGPLNLDVVYHTRQGVTGANQNGGLFTAAVPGAIGTPAAAWAGTMDSINEWYVGGSYDFKIVKVFASYQDMNDNNGTSRTELSNKLWTISAAMPVFGNGSLRAGYSRQSWDSTGAGDTNAWNVGYFHSLSKRTTLFTGVTAFDMDNTARAAASNSGVGAIGQKNYTYAAGMNHTF